MKLFFIINTLLFLTANKLYSKLISVGPIYTAELFIFFALLGRLRAFIQTMKTNPLFYLFFIYFGILLIWELIFEGYADYTLRRFAIFFYFIFPLLFITYLDLIKNNFKFLILGIPVIGLIITVISPENFQPTTLAEVLGALLLISIINKKYQQLTLLIGIVFFTTISGYFSDQSMYRTPLIVFSTMIMIYFILKKKNNLSVPYAIAAFFVISPILIFTGVLGNLLMGISGLTGIELLSDIGVYVGAQEMTTRGNAAGTTETRALFWGAILNHSVTNPTTFLFGSGFKEGFLEVTMPYFEFTDKELIEPHNAFMGIYFKTGIIGLLLSFIFIWQIYKLLYNKPFSENTLPFLIGGILYASMEVSLENPHGAITFWFIIFANKFFIEENSNSNSNKVNYEKIHN
jgi:hypothetical protein